MASKQASSKTGSKKPAAPAMPDETQSELDALALLKGDHQEVAALLEDFDEAEEDDKQDIAADICRALTVHAQIEEEIFYPAAREVLADDDLELVNEADVEHGAVKQLIAQLEDLDGSDDHFDAMVTVLGEYVKHHVREEENELFPRIEATDLDLAALGQALAERKFELSAE
jgi:hemerythrin superfamily protein